MSPWMLVDTHPTQGRTFRRPLDVTEVSFVWDGLFNGTADNLLHAELRLVDDARDAHLFSDENITRAWLSTKRRYPLAGATVQGADGPLRVHTKDFTSEPHFVVQEHDLAALRPHEIVFGQVSCAEDARKRMSAMLGGPRSLSETLLVQLHIFRETGSKTESEEERNDVLYLMMLVAHCVTDGVANATLMRCMVDTLARGGGHGEELAQVPLERRLALAIPSVKLEPMHLHVLSPAIRRWRRAAGAVIFQLRMEKRKGGHTLPFRFTPSTHHIAAKSARVYSTLTRAQTARVMSNCHMHNITFGNVYFVLAQVAMTRVLYRRYLCGEISEEEWAYRQKQPHICGSPFNLRLYLDKEWFEKGGAGEFALSISFMYYQLPAMTLGTTAERYWLHKDRPECDSSLDGAPPFSELLTFEMFLRRVGLVKRQVTAFFDHPLFHEIVRATSLAHLEGTRLGALRWLQRVEVATGSDKSHGNSGKEDVLAFTDMPAILAHGLSTVGDTDFTFPSEYPLTRTHRLSPSSSTPHPFKVGYVTKSDSPISRPASAVHTGNTSLIPGPKIVVEQSHTFLHARPSELYLGAASTRGQLNMYVFYDGNVFEDGIVEEWLGEVKGAVLWYLGQKQNRSRSHGDESREERAGEEGVRARM